MELQARKPKAYVAQLAWLFGTMLQSKLSQPLFFALEDTQPLHVLVVQSLTDSMKKIVCIVRKYNFKVSKLLQME